MSLLKQFITSGVYLHPLCDTANRMDSVALAQLWMIITGVHDFVQTFLDSNFMSGISTSAKSVIQLLININITNGILKKEFACRKT